MGPRFAAFLLLMGALAACDFVEPAVGDPLSSCVDTDSNPGHDIDFATEIRPRFDGSVAGLKGCRSCHYEVGTREGLDAVGLDLQTLGEIRRGGVNTSKNIIVPGSPCNSAIVQKLRGTFGGARMPKTGPYWSREDIQIVMDWIAEGAKGEDSQ